MWEKIQNLYVKEQKNKYFHSTWKVYHPGYQTTNQQLRKTKVHIQVLVQKVVLKHDSKYKYKNVNSGAHKLLLEKFFIFFPEIECKSKWLGSVISMLFDPYSLTNVVCA